MSVAFVTTGQFGGQKDLMGKLVASESETEGINWNNDGLIEANEMSSSNTPFLLFSSPFLITLNSAINPP